MTAPPGIRQLRRAPRARRVLIAAGLALLAVIAAGAGSAHAEACPGSGSLPCPWTAVQVVGQRAEGVLRFPEAVAVGPQGDVYVADQLSYAVQKFSPAGALETEWGSYGGGHGQFGPIGGIAVDGAGDVYVVDSSHDRIERFDAAGTFLSSWGSPGHELGQFSFGSSQNPSNPPGGGIAVAGTHVYVADTGNHRIERFNLEGGEATQWGGAGSAPGQFLYPRGVAANEGEVLVADDDNHRIQKFDPNGVFQAAAGSRGSGPGQFGFPYGVALDAAGDVFVADDLNHRVVKLTAQLQFAGAWGGYGSKPGQLAYPRAVASDPAGNTYVADTANDRIQVFDPGGNLLRVIGISAHGPGLLTAPRGLATDPTGGLLVSDTVGNRVELFAPAAGAWDGQWTSAGGRAPHFSAPAGLAVDPRGPVYLADQGNARLVQLWGDGTFLAELASPPTGQPPLLAGARTVAVDPASQRIYVADTGHNRILVYGPEGALLASWGAGGGNGAAGSAAGEYDQPQGIAVGGSGEVYVADTANNRIVKLGPDGGVRAIWGSRGTGDGRFRSPIGVAVDGAGLVYVLDYENNRVQAFDGDGHFLARWGTRGIGAGQLSQPGAIAVDCAGAVYVADTNNNRVERFQLAAPHGRGCLPPGSWPPPLDVTPVLAVALPRSRGILARRALALSVSCQRACNILASATLAPRRASGRHRRARTVGLVPVARGLPASAPGHVRLRLTSRGLRLLRRELGRHRGLVAHVVVVAQGPTGRRTTLTRSYLVRR